MRRPLIVFKTKASSRVNLKAHTHGLAPSWVRPYVQQSKVPGWTPTKQKLMRHLMLELVNQHNLFKVPKLISINFHDVFNPTCKGLLLRSACILGSSIFFLIVIYLFLKLCLQNISIKMQTSAVQPERALFSIHFICRCDINTYFFLPTLTYIRVYYKFISPVIVKHCWPHWTVYLV